jgi:hypothetical protein
MLLLLVVCVRVFFFCVKKQIFSHTQREEARLSAKNIAGCFVFIKRRFRETKREKKKKKKKAEEARDARARARGGDHGFFLFPEEGEEQAEEE